MLKAWYGCARALCCTFTFFSATAATYAEALPLKVEIEAPAVSPNGREFYVIARVLNTGKDEQTLHIESCSYTDDWKADNPLILGPLAINCGQNHVVDARLKPDKFVEQKLLIRIRIVEKFEEQPVTFRLGFRPRAKLIPMGHPFGVGQ